MSCHGPLELRASRKMFLEVLVLPDPPHHVRNKGHLPHRRRHDGHEPGAVLQLLCHLFRFQRSFPHSLLHVLLLRSKWQSARLRYRKQNWEGAAPAACGQVYVKLRSSLSVAFRSFTAFITCRPSLGNPLVAGEPCSLGLAHVKQCTVLNLKR